MASVEVFVADRRDVEVGEGDELKSRVMAWDRVCGVRGGLAARSIPSELCFGAHTPSGQRPGGCSTRPSDGACRVARLARARAHGNAAGSAHVRWYNKRGGSTRIDPTAPLQCTRSVRGARCVGCSLHWRSEILHRCHIRHTAGKAGPSRTRCCALAHSCHSPDVPSNLADDGAHILLVPADPVFPGVQVQVGPVTVAVATDG